MGLFKKKKNPERISEGKKSPLDEMDPSIRPGGVFMVPRHLVNFLRMEGVAGHEGHLDRPLAVAELGNVVHGGKEGGVLRPALHLPAILMIAIS